MRRAFIGFLMAATAAMPIAAQAQDRDRTDGRAERAAARAERAQEHYRQQGERNQARSERRQEAQTQRVERQQVRQERVEAPAQQQQQQTYSRRSRGEGQGNQSWSGGQRGQRWSGQNDSQRQAYRRQIDESRAASQASADQTIGGNYARQAQRNQQRYEQRVREDRRDGRDWNRGGRDDRWSDNRNDRRSSWNRSWRNDNRYNWQSYRYSNRDRFRLGSYYSPYRNYRYNRLSIGLILDSLFYSNRYWLSDPWQYRLPAAPYGTQWVRYYNDVVLVDVYTGEVIDVIHDFFW